MPSVEDFYPSVDDVENFSKLLEEHGGSIFTSDTSRFDLHVEQREFGKLQQGLGKMPQLKTSDTLIDSLLESENHVLRSSYDTDRVLEVLKSTQSHKTNAMSNSFAKEISRIKG
jgi:hypothetical protein